MEDKVQNSNSAQSLNLYGYVNNNPLVKADKDGHCFDDFCIVEVTVGLLAVKAAAGAYKAWNKLLSDGKRSKDAESHAIDCVGKDCDVESIEDFQKAQVKLPNDAANAALQTVCAIPGTTCSGPVPNGKPGPADVVNGVLQTAASAAGAIDPNKPKPQPKPQPKPDPTPPPPTPPQPTPPKPKDTTWLRLPELYMHHLSPGLADLT